MITAIEVSPLYPIVNPKSLAFFGASNNFNRMGSIMLSSLVGLGYEGRVYPIHRTEKEVRGYKAYQSVEDLPETPDLAVIVLPTDVVCETMEACGRKGVKHAIVVSGGFKEVGPQGAHRQQKLEKIADEYGIRFLGPNCLGVANLHLKLNPTPIPAEGPPGFVGLASQSGSFVTQMFNYLYRHGMGFSTALSVGNEANIDVVDCMEYLGACPNTKVIALYIEGIRRGQEFMNVARSITPHKPIVALYIGGSETGKRAGLSHTGALAGPDEIYDGIFRQSGVIRATTLSELFDFCLALGTLPKPGGNRVIIQTHSGGPGAAASDSLGRAGLELPPLSSDTIKKLRAILPKTASTNNPVDVTFSKNPLDDFSTIPDILLQEEHADMLLVYFVSPEAFLHRASGMAGMPPEEVRQGAQQLVARNIEIFCDVIKRYGKPVVGYTYRSLQEQMARGLLDRGIPVYQDPERAARAMATLIEYHRLREKIAAISTQELEDEPACAEG